jgi:hypothetical protein
MGMAAFYAPLGTDRKAGPGIWDGSRSAVVTASVARVTTLAKAAANRSVGDEMLIAATTAPCGSRMGAATQERPYWTSSRS